MPRDPYRTPLPLLYCHCGARPGLVCAVHREKRRQIRRARHSSASQIATELADHHEGLERDHLDAIESDGVYDDPWECGHGPLTFAEPVTLPEPFATLADVA